MTYEQIEKEFDEYFKGNILDNKLHCNTVYVKSFLKQSFIEYLQSEVERCKGDIRTDILERFWSNEKTQGYNLALERRITHLQAQIKELEV